MVVKRQRVVARHALRLVAFAHDAYVVAYMRMRRNFLHGEHAVLLIRWVFGIHNRAKFHGRSKKSWRLVLRLRRRTRLERVCVEVFGQRRTELFHQVFRDY